MVVFLRKDARFSTRTPWNRHVQPRSAEGFYRNGGKRVFDVVLASLLLVLLAPLLAFLMLIVAMDGGAPIFGQTRVGQSGGLFRCLKIRSMRRDADVELVRLLAEDRDAAAEWARDARLSDDPRVTRVGAFLRKASLDDLPKLINVLRGEMSIVGPRPVIMDELDRYVKHAESYMAVKPGLTGLWQTDGRHAMSYDDRVELDVAYAETYGFWRDVEIIFRTALAGFKLTGK